ncbi:hypothetical protein Ct9H90mP12_1850 [bacterium]|nr:MAG: hypothetical protein Ct9H90mP12_1850 [bacterium]
MQKGKDGNKVSTGVYYTLCGGLIEHTKSPAPQII